MVLLKLHSSNWSHVDSLMLSFNIDNKKAFRVFTINRITQKISCTVERLLKGKW